MLDYEPKPTTRQWPAWIVFGLIPLVLAVIGITIIVWAHARYYGYDPFS
ncbi:MAG TPA: hypothetical protein VFB66_23385 [Tepidisphaeraceae bacterium]|nr:hypothetical protein [Tepidisphaeraceae bacterium]